MGWKLRDVLVCPVGNFSRKNNLPQLLGGIFVPGWNAHKKNQSHGDLNKYLALSLTLHRCETSTAAC